MSLVFLGMQAGFLYNAWRCYIRNQIHEALFWTVFGYVFCETLSAFYWTVTGPSVLK